MAVPAWQVHDTGLVAVLPRFRRLPGRRSALGRPWPPQVELEVAGDELVVRSAGEELGRWPLAGVRAVRIAAGPPTSFTVDLGPDGAHLLAAAPGEDLDALLAALSGAGRG